MPSFLGWRLGATAWLALVLMPAGAQQEAAGRAPHPGALFDQGLARYQTPELHLTLMKSSGTVAGLESLPDEPAQPGGKGKRETAGYDFTPFDLLAARSVDGYFHLGDLNLRLRVAGNEHWRGFSTAAERHPVVLLPAEKGELEREDLAPTLGPVIPLRVVRSWAVADGHLALRFTLSNPGNRAVEVGALGIPLVFNSVITGRSLEQAHRVCNFSDPSISGDGGYVQVTRLDGHGPALLVVPEVNAPLEAYRPLEDARKATGDPVFQERTPRQQTFEGFYEWMTASLAYQQNEWKGVEQWNPATSFVIQPGESRVIGVRFLVAPSIRGIEQTLAQAGRPVVVGIPGYVLPQDVKGDLLLKAAWAVKSIDVEPAGALQVEQAGKTAHGWLRYSIRGVKWGSARLRIVYANGSQQTVHYRVIKPEAETVDDLGQFLFTRQWYEGAGDPFHRGPSIMSYDRERNQLVLQDTRVWIAGLSDEAGAGSWLAGAMKEFARPQREQVEKLERFVDGVLWGGLQVSEGNQKYGVRRSLFYYAPEKMPAGTYDAALDWSTWSSWKKDDAQGVWRSYNYPHVVAAYWALYRIARYHPGMVTHHDAQWYLRQAEETILAMMRFAEGQAMLGQMEGSVFLGVLQDLRDEKMDAEAGRLEAAMRKRAEAWKAEPYPFGSEMAWDSTGQEEVYMWCQAFGLDKKAQVTIDAITGYMPAIPHWGYNGNARRYWDFLYGGKYPRLERQLHHYGSGVNAIPVLDSYRRHPEDLYLLRIGYGGNMGALTGIDQEGFASAAFHSYPDRMAFDPYSGDYGPNFFGHVWTAGSYLVNDPEFGWIAFGGNVEVAGDVVTMEPRDSMRQRVYVEPLGAWLTLDAGRFARVQLHMKSGELDVELEPSDRFTPKAYLRMEQTAVGKPYPQLAPGKPEARERGAYVYTLGTTNTRIHFAPSGNQVTKEKP